jgi:hypothetical protein
MVESIDSPSYPFIRNVWSYLKDLYQGLGEEADNIIYSIEANCDLLKNDYNEPAAEHFIGEESIRFFTNQSTSLYNQCTEWIGNDTIKTITVMSPFYDSKAELIKALFLCNTKQMENKRQLEIALQWDTIERELHDEDFWYFLTKKNAEDYATRIELVFDFFASGRSNQNDPLSTFLYFNEIKKTGKSLSDLWEEILRYYYRLKEWYKKDALYHRIGYLVASGHMTMSQIVDATINLRKSAQEQLLDEEIKKSVKFKKAYSDLNYVNNYNEISRLLLLFNVASVMNHTHSRFPFRAYNTEQWSLEHIHPQHPEDMKNDKKLWNEWLRIQKLSVEQMPVDDERDKGKKDALVAEAEAFIYNERATKEDFKTLSDKIVQFLSDKTEADLTHSLSNMALLSKSQNSALNNSLFDAKRREIIEMDRRGEFIPYCTRNVFLKYYTAPDKVQMAKWSEADREGYVAAMNKVLVHYLDKDDNDKKNNIITI